MFAQRRDGRVAAMQYLYAWSINPPEHLAQDLDYFFANLEQPRGRSKSMDRRSTMAPSQRRNGRDGS